MKSFHLHLWKCHRVIENCARLGIVYIYYNPLELLKRVIAAVCSAYLLSS